MSKSEKRQKDRWMKFRCTEEEFELINAKARAAEISTSELLRRSALNRKIVTRTDKRLMSEMLRLGGLQKHLYGQMKDGMMTTELSKQFSEVLVALKKAIVALDLDVVPVDK